MVAFRYRHFPPPPYGTGPGMAKHRLILATLIALTLVSCARTELSDAEIVALDAVAQRAEIVAGRVSALRVTQAY